MDLSYTILIVDDTSFMRKMSADYLTQYGYTVAGEAKNGKEAVERYEALQPDIVLMDLTMPEMNGNEAIKEILKLNPSAVILVCTASNQKDLIFEALDAGAKGYITKPFNPRTMNDIIQKYAVPHLLPSEEEAAVMNEIAAAVAAIEEAEEAVEVEAAEAVEALEVQAVDAAQTSESNALETDKDLLLSPTTSSQLEDKPMENTQETSAKAAKHRPQFITSYMCNWKEDIQGEQTAYSVVCTENENKFVVEMASENGTSQSIQFSLDGFQSLVDWLNTQLRSTAK
jgi:CheY-like chemotaxis protein